MTLHDLPTRRAHTIVGIGGPRSFRRRLMEMGLLPGTPVRVLRHNRVGGLVEFEVRGCAMSLRSSEAAHVRFDS